jgi:hypothetical protein
MGQDAFAHVDQLQLFQRAAQRVFVAGFQDCREISVLCALGVLQQERPRQACDLAMNCQPLAQLLDLSFERDLQRAIEPRCGQHASTTSAGSRARHRARRPVRT